MYYTALFYWMLSCAFWLKLFKLFCVCSLSFFTIVFYSCFTIFQLSLICCAAIFITVLQSSSMFIGFLQCSSIFSLNDFTFRKSIIDENWGTWYVPNHATIYKSRCKPPAAAPHGTRVACSGAATNRHHFGPEIARAQIWRWPGHLVIGDMVAFLKKIKLSLGLSRAHFFRPHLPKVVRMCVFQHFLRNWALASVSCTFYRRLFQIEACTRGNTDPPTRDPWGHHTRKKQWFVRHCAPTLCQTQVHALLDCYCDLIYCFHLPTAVASSMINILTW